jgi:hypothetical protein
MIMGILYFITLAIAALIAVFVATLFLEVAAAIALPQKTSAVIFNRGIRKRVAVLILRTMKRRGWIERSRYRGVVSEVL